MDARSKSLVHRDLQRHLLVTVAFTLAGGLVGAAYGWSRIPEILGYAWLVAGVALMALSIPLWNAEPWACVAIGTLTGLLAVAHVIAVLQSGEQDRELGASIAAITYAAYFWLPSTRDVFREAREARTRQRALERRDQRG